MAKCTAKDCEADITWAVNLKTMSRVPLVPFLSSYPAAVRYDLGEPRSDGQRECTRNDKGDWMNHHANCTGVKEKPWKGR